MLLIILFFKKRKILKDVLQCVERNCECTYVKSRRGGARYRPRPANTQNVVTLPCISSEQSTTPDLDAEWERGSAERFRHNECTLIQTSEHLVYGITRLWTVASRCTYFFVRVRMLCAAHTASRSASDRRATAITTYASGRIAEPGLWKIE